MIDTKTETYEVALKRARLRDSLAERCRENFRYFVRASWPTAEPSRDLVKNWHIDAVAEHLQAVSDGQIKNLLVTMPPGHGKSLLVSVAFPAWMWLKNPKWRSIFASYASELSTRDSVRCRSLMDSEWYQETFHPEWKFSSDQNVKTFFENTDKGFRFSTSVGAKATGFRSDCLICDDPLNVKDLRSEAALEECIFWWDVVMSSRLNDMSTGNKIIIMQRVSERDLAGHVLRNGGYVHLNLPTEFEIAAKCTTSIGWSDPRKEEGELLFPAMFPKDVITEAKKSLGTYDFAAQHQQRPVPAGGGMLKEHWWNYWVPAGMADKVPVVNVKRADGIELHKRAIELPATFDAMLQSWDMAFKGNTDSDFVVGQVIAAKGASRFVLAQDRGRRDFPETLNAVRRLSTRYPGAYMKLVEDKANGPAVIQSLHHEVGGFVAVNPIGGKESRAAALSPEVEAGNWYLPHPCLEDAEWVKDFIKEASSFPVGLNDDQVDCLTQGGARLKHIKGDVQEVESVMNGFPKGGSNGQGHWSA